MRRYFLISSLILLMCFSTTTFAVNYNDKMELIESRDALSKHYLNPDGSITAIIHQVPVHYKNNGKWDDIISNFEQISGTKCNEQKRR